VNVFHLRSAVAWLVIVGVGCSSVPVHFYTLTRPPEKTLPASPPDVAIDVRVVHLPPQLHHSELMIRTGPGEVTLLDNERWAAPLNDEIKDALRLELQRRLGRMAGLRPASTKLTLDIDVQHLEAELGRYALLQVSWSATGPRAATCTFEADERIHAGYADMIEGYQREIAALADAIAVVVTSPAGSSDASCQRIEGSAGESASKDQ
jgi:uncharacterized protein